MAPVAPNEYMHDLDHKALRVLKAIPGFSAVLKTYMKIMNEQKMHALNMASKVRLGPRQLPEIYRLLPPICEKLGIAEPELYLEMNPSPNAYTSGDTLAFITVTSGLLESMEEDEIRAVLAHECGHIACHHVLYHTMASLILNGGSELFDLGLISLPLQLALFHWQRCSEFSSDRAAAICLGGPDSIVETMIRLSGGPKSITNKINKQLYLEQAAEYEQQLSDSKWDRALVFLSSMHLEHPFTAVRAAEITKWCASDAFRNIASHTSATSARCSFCGAPWNAGWAFCSKCGAKYS